MKKEEIKYIDYQIITLVIGVVTSIIAIVITYNQKLAKLGKKTILNNKDTLSLTTINRIVILLSGFFFLYINYELYKIAKAKKQDLKSYNLQIVASILVVISELIALYVISLSSIETNADIENPNI